MTKREVYKRVFGKEAIHIEGIDWDSEVDDAFEMELEVIKQMVEGMQNESNIDNQCTANHKNTNQYKANHKNTDWRIGEQNGNI